MNKKNYHVVDLPLTATSMLAEIGTLVLRLGDKRISPVDSLICTKLALLPVSTRYCNCDF